MSASSNASGSMVEITATQKMISAMSGSLLTTLLVTPLDVVRVRWQSQSMAPTNQTPPQPTASRTCVNNADLARRSPTSSGLQPMTADFRRIVFQPPETLGVTACCREVFFSNSNAQYCLAGNRLEGLPGGLRPIVFKPDECAVSSINRAPFTSTFDGMRKIARHEGVTSLWRGLSPTLIMSIPANIIYFTGYDWLRTSHNSPITLTTPEAYAPLAAGAVARVLAASAVSPIELFKTRLQATPGTPGTRHLVETFRGVETMVKHQGYRSLWRGIGLTLWRDVPFSGIYWWGYESIRNLLADIRESRINQTASEYEKSVARQRRRFQDHGTHIDTFVDSFTAGALSGAVASIMTMPFDVGKTRIQIFRTAEKPDGPSPSKSSAQPEQRSIARFLWHIFQTEGVAGLFRGWVPRVLKVAPACAIMVSSYEVGKRAFRRANERAAAQEGLVMAATTAKVS